LSLDVKRAGFSRDLNTKSQLDRSSSRVAALIAEGFGKALRKKFISVEEHQRLSWKYTTIGKRLTRWIHYFDSSNWKDRR